ncbi:DUF2817 domain-containing protein [Aquamicrobium ahrensii]|uniref:DUF2817 domain-containing protein n=1 Tax=Aquamicrobium ahrensii TaxID=469551 RepID=A0ABV2KRI0_9HYPH
MSANENECGVANAFSNNFSEAREKFLLAARKAGAGQVDSFDHPLSGPDGKPLACDVAFFGDPGARHLIVTLSGLHGVEAWAGAACQVAWCQDGRAARLPADVAIAHVHAINPWGMAWDRRQQEDNIDLNRHFVDFEHLPDDSEYGEYVGDVMCPETDPDARRKADTRLADFLRRAGRRHYGMVLQGGQYRYPDAPSFGGVKPSWSHGVLDRILAAHCARAKRIVVCDFHTGYGPYGYGVPLWHLGEGPQLDKARILFGPTLEAPLAGEGAEDEYIQHGHLYGHVMARLPDQDVVAMCFEFGGEVLRPGERALLERADALMWRDQDRLSKESRAARRRWRHIHVPDRDDWREMVLARGGQVLRELTSRIGQLD